MILWIFFISALLVPFFIHGIMFLGRSKSLSPQLKFEEVIERLDLSIHGPMTYCYSFYILILLGESFHHYSIELMLATQVLLTLVILNFLSFLISPFPASLSILSKIKVHEHKVSLSKHWYSLRFGHTQEWVIRHLQRYFYYLRMDVYKAFLEHEKNEDIRSYLLWKSRVQREIDDWMHGTILKFDPVPMAKKIFIIIILLFFMVNYILIYNGVQHDVLHFSQNLSHWEAPLYYLVSTFSTVGYGDVTPVDPVTRSFALFLLSNTVLILLIVVNVIQDYTAHTIEQILAPFKSYQTFLREETYQLIYWVETNQVHELLDRNSVAFKEYPELRFVIECYCKKNQASQD